MARQTTDNPITVTPDRAADLLGIAPRKVRELLYSKEIASFKMGTRWLIPVKALEEWVEEQTRKAVNQ